MKVEVRNLRVGDEVESPVLSRIVVVSVVKTEKSVQVVYKTAEGKLVPCEYVGRDMKTKAEVA